MTDVAHFTITFTQYLNVEGQPTQPLPAFADKDTLIHLYRTMVLLRAYDVKAVALQRTGKLGTYAQTLGQEAISVGLGYAMKKEDVLTPCYREYGAQIQRGVRFSEILLYWGGDERGSHFAQNAEDFPISVPIGTQVLHAAGAAYAFKYRKQPRVAVAVCGDGATSQGDFYEALNFAGVTNVPAVFLINNNQWAISVPRSKQTKCQTLAQKAIAAGIPGEQVDGNDIIAVVDVLKRALDNARTGKGPCVVEALTYRLSDHTTADDASRYRSKSDFDHALSEEPIKRLRLYLTDKFGWTAQDEQQLMQTCATEVEKEVDAYLNIKPPLIEDMFKYQYAEMPPGLREQCEQAKAYPIEGGNH